MRRILYLSPMAPDPTTGGGRHVYSNLAALVGMADDVVIDVISPTWPATVTHLRASGRVNLVETRSFGRRDKLAALLGRNATSLYGLWRDARDAARGPYVLAFVETTRCGFAMAELSARWPTVCVVHNVEADFLAQNRRGLAGAARLFARRSERQTLAHAHHILVLHDTDRARLEALYGRANIRGAFRAHPVCSLDPAAASPLPWAARNDWVAYVGSLDLPYNERGLLAFMRDAWPRLSARPCELLVAGRRPTRHLVQAVGRAPSAILVPNPTDLEPLLRRARVLILPDLSGTGMKLRVAEALSHGVPVVGTRIGLRGYESSFGPVVRACDTPSEMGDAVARLLTSPDASDLVAEAHAVWREGFTYETFAARLGEIVAPLLEQG